MLFHTHNKNHVNQNYGNMQYQILNFQASQEDDPKKYDTASLHIAVKDRNDYIPTFDRKVYTLDIPEYPNVTDGQPLLKVHAVDKDQVNEFFY